MSVVERFTPNSGQEWLEEFVQSLVKVVVPFVNNKVILDAGCGYGYVANYLLTHGAKKIDAYDISDEAINYAKKTYESPKIQFEIKDFNSAVFKKNYYDVAVSMEVIEHLTNYEFHLKQLHAALKKGGLLFINTPNGALSDHTNEFHIKEFSYEELTTLIERLGFTMIKSTGFNCSASSSVAGKYTPRILVTIAKHLPFYGFLMKLFFKPSKSTALSSETMVFIYKKL